MSLTLVNNNMNTNCNMDEFIRIFVQMEKRLMIEQSDPNLDFQIINHWIDYVQSLLNESNERSEYFLNEVIPKVTKAIMIRTYANNDQHINAAKELLRFISVLIGSTIGMNLEGLHKFLPEFLDASNVFYCKYGGANTNSNVNDNRKRNRDISSNENESKYNRKSSDLDFLRSCALDDVIDCRKGSNRKWALAGIKALSFDTNIIKVQYEESGITETIDLNEEPDRVAPFMSKVLAVEADDIDDLPDDLPELVEVGSNDIVNDRIIYPNIDDDDDDDDVLSYEGNLNFFV